MAPLIISGPSGGAPNRLEIRDFIKNDKFFSLYIQALLAMSVQDQKERQSYFQISGIHGLPNVPWDDVTGTLSKFEWGGYCTHESVIFPTWHRPYMSLYEQTLQQHAKSIAACYTCDKKEWEQAACDLRMPFWDWGINSIPPDEVIVLKQVTITGPDGRKVKVDNPLYHYKFHPIDPSFQEPYNKWQTTLRHPANNDPNATDDVAALKKILGLEQTNIKNDTYNMLTRIHNWPEFSNSVADGSTTNKSSTNSLETIHDHIHLYCGGDLGHMAQLELAAFDPIFYLHHANVDRLISLWSALNPGVWVTPGNSGDGSITLPPDTAIDVNTVLTPFWNTETTFWASAGLEDTTKLGYTYPDFNGLDMGNRTAVQNAISDRVNRLYGVDVFGGPSSGPGSTPVGSLPAKRPDHGVWDWTVRVEFKMHELHSSFFVLIFLGEVPEDPRDWHTCPNYVGSACAFVNNAALKCSNCASQQDVVLEEYVHLDHAIASHSKLTSLDPSVIEPYLTSVLKWRVQKLSGEPAELKSLGVSVLATPLSYPPGAKFPVPGPPRLCNGITVGKPGGSVPVGGSLPVGGSGPSGGSGAV